MGNFAGERHVLTQLTILRTGDTVATDLSDFLTDAMINFGDVSQIGDSGADGVSRTLDFFLKNDNDNNFSPLSKYGVLKYFVYSFGGNGGSTYTIPHNTVIENTIRVRKILGTTYTWADLGTWAAAGTFDSALIPDADYQLNFTVSGYTLTTSQNIASGHFLRIGYTYMDKTTINPYNWRSTTYAPLIWENSKVFLKSAAGSPVFHVQTIIGTGAQRYAATYENIIKDTVRFKSATTSFYTAAISFDYDTQEIVFDNTNCPQTGTTVYIQYSYIAETPRIIFEGYISEFQVEKSGVSVFCKDQAKLLQDAFVRKNAEGATVAKYQGTIRTYTVTNNGSIATPSWSVADSTPTTWTGGIPLDEFMQNCIDDVYEYSGTGDHYIELIVPTRPSYNILPDRTQTEYKTLWDILQSLANQIGWYCGYVYSSVTQAYELTLLEPDRANTTADYTIVDSTDVYAEQLRISGANIRNSIQVTFLNTANNSQRESVLSEDATSIALYGTRPVDVEEENTSAIDTVAEATAFADAILADSKDLLAGVKLELPLLPEIELFDLLSVDNYNLSSDIDLVSVQNISHTISPSQNRFRTTVSGYQKVVGGLTKWQKMQTRPSKFRQITSKTTDTVLAKVRDDTIYIKTQADFNSWINSFHFSATAPTVDTFDYTKVLIYDIGVDYTFDFFPTASLKRLYAKVRRLEIIGIGNPTLHVRKFDPKDGYMKFAFVFMCDELMIDSIHFKVSQYDATDLVLPYTEYLSFVELINVLEYDNAVPTNGTCNILRCKFSNGNGTTYAGIQAIVPRTDNLTQMFKIADCTFIDVDGIAPSFALDSDVASGVKFTLENNYFTNKTFSRLYFAFYAVADVGAMTFSKNTFINNWTVIQIYTVIGVGTLIVNNLRVVENTWNFSVGSVIAGFLFSCADGDSYISNSVFSNNTLICDNVSGNFITLTGNATTTFSGITISNNVAQATNGGTFTDFLHVTGAVTQTAVGETNNQSY